MIRLPGYYEGRLKEGGGGGGWGYKLRHLIYFSNFVVFQMQFSCFRYDLAEFFFLYFQCDSAILPFHFNVIQVSYGTDQNVYVY